MKYAFIGGIPAAGKSYLAGKVAATLGISHFKIDNWWDELRVDPKLRKWVNFYWNQDEEKYWRDTDCSQQWENLKNQSDTLWPAILERIKKIKSSSQPAIFEGVGILPHLAHRDLDFQGVFLLGESFEIILERNKLEPRWGKTEELKTKQAQAFWNCERPHYAEEAEKYGFKTFDNAIGAEKVLLRMLS